MIILGHISAGSTSFVQFRALRASVITLLSRCQVSVNWPGMVHNDTICRVIARCVPLWPHLTQRSLFCSILKNLV